MNNNTAESSKKLEIQSTSHGAESGHWYNEGGLVLGIPSAKGDKLVKPTIRHARQGLVVPSVTTILNMFDKPALTQWKLKEYVKACSYIEPKGESESEDEYFARVQQQFNSHNDHAKIGTHVHAEIAKGLIGKPHDKIADHAISYVFSEYVKMINPVIKSEKPFANFGYGFGGTVDLILEDTCNKIIIDFKTTDDDKLSQESKLAYRDSHLAQLVAYKLGTHNGTNKNVRYINVFVGRLAGEIYVHEWDDPKDIEWSRLYFMLALGIFQHKNELK